MLWEPTEREQDVLRELMDTETQEEVADRLGLSPRTVHYHINSLLRKARVKSQKRLLVEAIRLRYIYPFAGRGKPKSYYEWDVTEREKTILKAMLDFETQEEVAKAIGISPRTLRTHLRNLLRKARVQSQKRLLIEAIRGRFCDPFAGVYVPMKNFRRREDDKRGNNGKSLLDYHRRLRQAKEEASAADTASDTASDAS